MTGELDRGDAVVFEKYEGQELENGQVIVYKKGSARIVHRVIEIERVDGEIRYYTKGDMNEHPDTGYVVPSEIVGMARLKVPIIGYPTLWLRELVSDNLD